MTKTELLNKTARSEDERLLLARTLDLENTCHQDLYICQGGSFQ